MIPDPRAQHHSLIIDQEKETKQCLSPKPERCVSFCTSVVVHAGIYLTEYTDEEIDDCWYSQTEYLEFKKDIRRTLSMVERRLEIDEETVTTRGLEGRTKSGARIRSKNKAKARYAVLDEQHRQRIYSERDEQMMSVLYGESSATSRTTAHLTAVNDAKAAGTHRPPPPTTTRQTRFMALPTTGRKVFPRIKLGSMAQNIFKGPRRVSSAAA